MGKLTQRIGFALLFVVVAVMTFAPPARAQRAGKEAEPATDKKTMTPEEKAAADFDKAVKRAKQSEALFSGLTPIEVTLTTNIKRIRGDKKEDSPWRAATFA